jgi:hypothetical protein
MNETNRTAIVLVAAIWIILMAVVIFFTWAVPQETIDRLEDFVQFLDDNQTNAGKLIVTLSALVAAVLALLIIILELAPEEEVRELRVEQAGATTIVPAEALRARLEEALTALPDVTAARARVTTRDKGIASSLEVTVTPTANVAHVTQEATRVVVDTIQTDLGLPVSGVPSVRIAFGGTKPQAVASSTWQPPRDEPAHYHVERTQAPTREEETQVSAGSSPGPTVYRPAPDHPPQTEQTQAQQPEGGQEERREGGSPPERDE